MTPSALRLEALELWIQPVPGPLRPQLERRLQQEAVQRLGPGADVLRWAITAATADRGLRLEGVLLGPDRQLDRQAVA